MQMMKALAGNELSSERADGRCAVEGVSFAYTCRPTIQKISFSLAGEFLTLLGPSGCGKSTLLKLIGGYLTPAEGRITVGGRDVTSDPPERRNVGMVFQNYALFPHLSARRNISFGLEVRRLTRAAINARTDEMLALVGLTSAEAERRPHELSGGQQQRVALARALAFRPKLLLLDEPFANLDRHLRDQLRSELRRVQRTLSVSTIMVTHDPDEALAASDRIGVMANGRLLQIGPPAEVYRSPRTPFVARALGETNLLAAHQFGNNSNQLFLIRPEAFTIDGDGPHSWTGHVTRAEFLGADQFVEVACAEGPTLRVRTRASSPVSVGETIRVSVSANDVWPIPEADE